MSDHRGEFREGSMPVEKVVNLGRDRLGREYTGSGASFSLASIFGEGPDNRTFSEVYFETTDNIYRLEEDQEDRAGLLTDANASRRDRGRLNTKLLDRKTLADLKLIVGQPFDFGVGVTSPVKRIIGVVHEAAGGEHQDASQIEESTIISDFKTACLPLGAEH